MFLEILQKAFTNYRNPGIIKKCHIERWCLISDLLFQFIGHFMSTSQTTPLQDIPTRDNITSYIILGKTLY